MISDVKNLISESSRIKSFIDTLNNDNDIRTKEFEQKMIFSKYSLTNNEYIEIPNSALIFVVDITNEESVDGIIEVLESIEEYNRFNNLETYSCEKVILVNKYDLLLDSKKANDIINRIKSISDVKAFYVSAKHEINIRLFLTDLILTICNKYN